MLLINKYLCTFYISLVFLFYNLFFKVLLYKLLDYLKNIIIIALK